MYNLPLEACR